jgi:SAM-dependent methyltransferase
MTSDTGANLRSAYEEVGGVTSIFSARVADYTASRPSYPTALFAELQAQGAIAQGYTVADVGAGTGLFTQGLLEHGCNVFAIEPNAEMLAVANQSLRSFAGYRGILGRAEAIPLAASSVDLISVAQAFHWLEVEAMSSESLRVLKPSGQVALIWNDRVRQDPVNEALDRVCDEYGGAQLQALKIHEERFNVNVFFGDTLTQSWLWPQEQLLDEAGLLSLVFSRSYIPARDTIVGSEIQQKIQSVFSQFSVGGKVTVKYETSLILGRPSSQ